MKQHNGMRPQDIPVLLKIISKAEEPWHNKDLAAELFISPSEISESLYRSSVSGLIDAGNKKKVFRQSLMEFLQYGFHYVFPAESGSLTKGLYTGHSHLFMKAQFPGEENYVWPDPHGEGLGIKIDPLYKNQVKAAQLDPALYLMLALIDVLRIGGVREKKVAIDELKKMIL
jgi:hypothetical protein